MDFSIFNNFYKNFYQLITNFLNFFNSSEEEVEFEFVDENGNYIMKKIPSLGLLKKELKKEIEDELLVYQNFSKINNHYFDGTINYKYNLKKKKISIDIQGLAKYKTVFNIKKKQDLEIDFNYNNYLYYDIINEKLIILPKPFKIGLNKNYLVVSRNPRFSKYKNIDTNYLIYKNDIYSFFNDFFALNKKDIKIDFSQFNEEMNDYFELIFSFDKFININQFLIETDFVGKVQILASVNGKLYNKIYTVEIENSDSIKNIIENFPNVNYYKYYKVRFYNEKIKEQFTIKNLNLLTDEIIWYDSVNNTTNEIIDFILIQKQYIYLGEFRKTDKIIFQPYYTQNVFLTEFEKFNFNFCIDNPFKDETIDINIYISENKLGSIIEDGTKYFKILYNSEKIEVILHPDAYINNLNEFYIQLEIKRRDYDYFGT